MKEYLKKNAIWLLLAFVIGAIAMDYYNYMKAKDKGYAKISGFFKHTPGPENTL